MRLRRIVIAGIALVAAATVLSLPEAWSDVRDPAMEIAGQTLDGTVYTRHVSDEHGGGCTEEFADGVPIVKDVARVTEGSTQVVIDLHDRREPSEFGVEVYRRLKLTGITSGKRSGEASDTRRAR